MKIAIIGYGKMGKAIEKLLSPGDQVVLKINSANRRELSLDKLSACDVAIEFSTPNAAIQNIFLCINAGIPVVSGTTGWLEHMPDIKKLVAKANGAFFYAANYSIGVNLFFAINAYSAQLMANFTEYKVSMEEQHHIHKLDAPSGTAIRLSEDIIRHQPDLSEWALDANSNQALSINAVREGEIPGTHIVEYASEEDKITLSHQAFTRDSFARGALTAARWIIGKKGIYGMQDLLAI